MALRPLALGPRLLLLALRLGELLEVTLSAGGAVRHAELRMVFQRVHPHPAVTVDAAGFLELLARLQDAAGGEVRFDALELGLLVEAGVLRVEIPDAVEIAVRAVPPRVYPSGGHSLVTVNALLPGEFPLDGVRRRVEIDWIPVLLDGDRFPQISEVALAGMIGVVLVPNLVEIRLGGKSTGTRARCDDQARGGAPQCPSKPDLHCRALHHCATCALNRGWVNSKRPGFIGLAVGLSSPRIHAFGTVPCWAAAG